MDAVSEWLAEHFRLAPEMQDQLLTSLAVVLTIWLGRRLVMGLVRWRTEDVRAHYQWKKGSLYIASFVALVLLGRIWFPGFQELATYFGLLSAGIAIALKDLFVNLAGWAFILWRRPFEVGDRIQVGAHAGDVIDLRIFQFTLMEVGNWVGADQSTGRVIHVPNGAVFSEPVANYSKGFQFIWNEIAVLVTFESDWHRAKRLLEEIASRHAEHLSDRAAEQIRRSARKYMIFYSKLTPRVYTSVEASGVLLTIRYLCDPRKRRGSAEEMWEDIFDAFAAEAAIDFAYPTQRFYRNEIEGKPATRASALPDTSGENRG